MKILLINDFNEKYKNLIISFITWSKVMMKRKITIKISARLVWNLPLLTTIVVYHYLGYLGGASSFSNVVSTSPCNFHRVSKVIIKYNLFKETQNVCTATIQMV